MAGSKSLFGDNYFNAGLVVISIGRGKSPRGQRPSGVGCGFCSEQPISSHLVMNHSPLHTRTLYHARVPGCCLSCV